MMLTAEQQESTPSAAQAQEGDQTSDGLSQTQFIVQMIVAYARLYPGTTTEYAMSQAAQIFREFMADEKINYGDKQYDWSASGAHELVCCYEGVDADTRTRGEPIPSGYGEYTPITVRGSTTPQQPEAGADYQVREQAQFLLDRLKDFNPEEDGYREWHGHVIPAVARLEHALAALPTPASGTKSAPVGCASHNSGERLPSSNAAAAGADTASGMVMVPREPTDAMLLAGATRAKRDDSLMQKAQSYYGEARNIYKAMLSAVPQASMPSMGEVARVIRETYEKHLASINGDSCFEHDAERAVMDLFRKDVNAADHGP